MIGNAVPPAFSRIIADVVFEVFDVKNKNANLKSNISYEHTLF